MTPARGSAVWHFEAHLGYVATCLLLTFFGDRNSRKHVPGSVLVLPGDTDFEARDLLTVVLVNSGFLSGRVEGERRWRGGRVEAEWKRWRRRG